MHFQVVQDFTKIALGELTVEPPNQSHAFLPGEVLVPDFLRCIVGRPPEAELHERRVVVEVVNLVVDAVVFTVRALLLKWSRLKPHLVYRVIVCLLGGPFQVVPKVVNLHRR